MWARRDFIKRMAWLGAAMLLPFDRLRLAAPMGQVDARAGAEGELYAGFVLLPEDVAAPSFVKSPELGPALVCGVRDESAQPEPPEHWPYASLHMFDTVAELRDAVDFPFYILEKTPPGLRLGTISTLSSATGDVCSATLGFEGYNSEADYWECKVSLSAQPKFPRPVPLWCTRVELDTRAIPLRKVDFLPSPGVSAVGLAGHAHYWIHGDVLHTLAIHTLPAGQPTGAEALAVQEARAVAASLAVEEARGLAASLALVCR